MYKIFKKERVMKMNTGKIMHAGKKAGSIAYKLVRAVMLCGIAYYILYPILEKCLAAFMSIEDLYDKSVGIIPRHWTIENIILVMKNIKFSSSAFNSLCLCVVSVLTQVLSCTLVGYGFARFEFRGKKILFAAVILVLVIPVEVIITPLYLNYRYFDVFGIFKLVTGSSLNLLDSIWPFVINGLTCMGLRCGLYIYLIRQFYRGVPKELEEAAAIDGAGYLTTFLRVMLPTGRPMIFVIAIFSLVWQWTDAFYPNWFYSSSSVMAVQVQSLAENLSIAQKLAGVTNLDTMLTNMLDGIGTLLLTVPLIVVYMLTHKNLIGGIERSGIVG